MINWISKLPTTNLRIFVSIVLAVLFVLIVLIGVMFGKSFSEHTLYIIAGFILIMQGLDVAQFKVKRETHIPSPPNTPDIEDVGERG